jgi:hypothetical protein
MSSQDLPHVAKIEQRTDKTVRLQVEIVDYTPGQEIEISGYLTQGTNTYHAFRDKKHVPLDKPSDPSQSSVLVPVELPALDLSQDNDVTVVIQVAEVWPTVLEKPKIASELLGNGLVAEWAPKDPPGKGPWGGAPQPGGGGL